MLDTRGNSAVFLLQQHARICSVIRNSGVDIEALKKTGTIKLEHPTEKALAGDICFFQDLILSVLDQINCTHKLCDYFYELCNSYSTFYTNCRVIEHGKVNESRLMLCEATAMVMRQLFALLGIEALRSI